MSVVSFKGDPRIGTSERNRLREFVSELGSDIVRLANDLGLKVFEESLPPYESGYLEYAPSCGSNSRYRVVVNSNISSARQRFTVAHEIAHFVLHKDDPEFQKTHEVSADILSISAVKRSNERASYRSAMLRYEWEADQFAVTLLMPYHLIAKHPYFHRNRPDLLAAIVGVSEETMEVRFAEIGGRKSGRQTTVGVAA